MENFASLLVQYFRLEEAKCAQIYESMMSSGQDTSSEVLVNLMASLTRSNQADSARELVAKHKSALDTSYDLVYNSACALLEGGDLNGAENQLKQAEKQCRKAFEGAEGDDLNAELAPILTQLAYVRQRRGEDVEASQLYDKVLAMGISDLGVIAVCNNNLVSIRKSENATSISRLAALSKTQTQDKLSASQKKIVLYNRCILLLQAAKYDELQKLVKTLPATSEVIVLIQAATLVKKGQANKAIETLRSARANLKEKETNVSEASLRIPLSLAQIYLNQGSVKEAISILKSITALQYEPAFLATMVTLHQKMGDLNGAIALLDETAERLSTGHKKSTMDVAQVTTLLRKSAELKLANGLFSQATDTLSKILALNPGDVRIQATLALALASADPGRAEQFLKDLPKIAASPTSAEALETAPTPSLHRAAPIAVSAAAAAAASAASAHSTAHLDSSATTKQKKKRKRKNKPAKNAVAGTQPDPERWIPKHLRKGFRRRGAPAGGKNSGHQGAATNEALNKANTVAPTRSAPAAGAKKTGAGAAKKRPGGRRR